MRYNVGDKVVSVITGNVYTIDTVDRQRGLYEVDNGHMIHRSNIDHEATIKLNKQITPKPKTDYERYLDRHGLWDELNHGQWTQETIDKMRLKPKPPEKPFQRARRLFMANHSNVWGVWQTKRRGAVRTTVKLQDGRVGRVDCFWKDEHDDTVGIYEAYLKALACEVPVKEMRFNTNPIEPENEWFKRYLIRKNALISACE